MPEALALAAGLPQGAHVLDIGCGPGWPISQALVDAGLRVTGLDSSARLLSMFADFFAWKKPIDSIVTNPPWSLMHDFVEHALTLAPHVAFLTAVNHFWTKSRVKTVREAGFGYRQLLLIACHPEGFIEMGFQLGVMHLQKGYDGPMQISSLR